jgi:glycolate dehydrogenase FAD-binding subunit
MSELVKTLESIVGAAHLLAGGEARRYAVDGVVPEVAAFPGSVDEVSAVLAACTETKAAVVPWGAGVHMGLGAIPRRVPVIVGLGRLNRVLDHEPGDMTSTVQAGMVLSDYQAHLGRHGQFLSLDPPGAGRATVGGILAANASGPRRLRYGTARDLLIGLRVVSADGTVTKGGAKVVKNVTGYDMNKLYVGSLGTLGVIVEATFRLFPVPACERTWVAAFPTAAKARRVVAKILDSAVVPSALELLNDQAAQEVSRRMGVASTVRGVVLAAAIASVPEAVDAQVRAVQAMADEADEHETLEGHAHEAFWAAVRDFDPGNGSAVVLKASVVLDKAGEAMEYGERLAAQHGLHVAVISEAGTGILRLYFRADERVDRTTPLAEVVDSLRAFALQAKGSLVVLQAPVAVKERVDVWGSPGKGFAMMRGLKEQFDPGNILNPGRFVQGL